MAKGANAMGRDFETHRCADSVKALCSIRRYGKEDKRLRRDGEWHLYRREVDLDYDATYMVEVARIAYCPFCGEALFMYPRTTVDS